MPLLSKGGGVGFVISSLKPYQDRKSPLSSVGERKIALLLSIDEIIDQTGDTVPLSSADRAETQLASTVSKVDDVLCPSIAVVHGRLKNSKMLSKLDSCFSHLTQSQSEDVVHLIKSHVSLFSDVPSGTHVLQHNIDVGDSPPIKKACIQGKSK